MIDGDGISLNRDDLHPVLTVVILTYNHERYIEQAVRSVLAQRTTFPIEILVGEDYSTDGTRAILAQMNWEFPQRLTIVRRDRNLGLAANLQDCRVRARGRYLAILEGDDFWTDALKLQKQCDAMESHLDWSMCFHPCRIFDEDGWLPSRISPDKSFAKPLTIGDLLERNHVPTMSVAFFRQGIIRQTPSWHAELRNGDWALYILHADVGPVGFLPDVMTDYRVHQGGLWSGFGRYHRWQQTVELFEHLNRHFQGRYAAEIAESKQAHLDAMIQRDADLEKIERRYLALRLDRIAAVCRWVRDMWRRWIPPSTLTISSCRK